RRTPFRVPHPDTTLGEEEHEIRVALSLVELPVRDHRRELGDRVFEQGGHVGHQGLGLGHGKGSGSTYAPRGYPWARSSATSAASMVAMIALTSATVQAIPLGGGYPRSSSSTPSPTGLRSPLSKRSPTYASGPASNARTRAAAASFGDLGGASPTAR